MYLLFFFLSSSLLLLAAGNSKSKAHAQNASLRDSLIIQGEGVARTALHIKDLQSLPRKTVRAKDYKGGAVVSFEGVELYEVLKKAGLPFGANLKHGELSKYLLAEGHDGYKVAFTLAELEPLFTENIVLLADTKDGKPLDDYAGTMCIIIPHEKKNGRWMRQLKSLTVKRG